MKTIWKYPLELTASQIIRMPACAKILSVQTQRGVPCLWVLCSEGGLNEVKRVAIYGTGHPMPSDPGEFVGTFQAEDGCFVWHVFDASNVKA